MTVTPSSAAAHDTPLRVIILAETEVRDIQPLDGASGASGYALMTRCPTVRLGRQRILGPSLALISPVALPTNPPAALQRCFTAAQQAVNDWCDEAKIAE